MAKQKTIKQKANKGGYLVTTVINPVGFTDPEKHKVVLKVGDQEITKNNWECISKALGNAIATCEENSQKYKDYFDALVAIDRLVFMYGYLTNMEKIKSERYGK